MKRQPTARSGRRSLTRLRHFMLTTSLTLLLSAQSLLAEEGEGAHGHHDEHGDEASEAVELKPEVLKESGIEILTAGPQIINAVMTLTGVVVPQEDRVSRISPRYSGVLREVKKRLGDRVAANEVVAVVESNQSLGRYEVRSAIAGSIVQRNATVGESVGETTTIYEVADYGELFADFFVFPSDFKSVRLGQAVQVKAPDQGSAVSTALSFLSPVTDPATQSRFVRATLPNPIGAFQPGMFVVGDVVLEERAVPVAVAASAIRTSKNASVVFVQNGTRLEPRAVRVGRRDDRHAEVTDGLMAGERYAAGDTFLLLAELEKGEAEHDH